MSAVEQCVDPDTQLLRSRYWLHEELGRASLDRHEADIKYQADMQTRLSNPDPNTLKPYDFGPLEEATKAYNEAIGKVLQIEAQIRERWLCKVGYVPEFPMPETFGEALPERPSLRLIVSAEVMPATVELEPIEPVAPLEVSVLEQVGVMDCNNAVPDRYVAVPC